MAATKPASPCVYRPPHTFFSICLSSLVGDPCRVSRHFAGGSCASRQASRAAVAASTYSLSPQQLGEGEALDEDVAREVERIGQGGGDGDAIKVTAHRTTPLFFSGRLPSYRRYRALYSMLGYKRKITVILYCRR